MTSPLCCSAVRRRSCLGTLVIVVTIAGCSAPSSRAGTDDSEADVDVASPDTGRDEPEIGHIEPIDAADAADAVDTEVDGADSDALEEGCDTDEDCEIGICVDLLPGPRNGICAMRCIEDAQCADNEDCVLVNISGDPFGVCIDVEFCFDRDGDGFGVGPGCLGPDCDDSNPAINPAAPEVCNGIDDNCNGLVDDRVVESGDDCETGFAGVCAEGRLVCTAGLLECVSRVAASPEVCDGLDNDCNGMIDDGAIDAPTWFRDADNDRFGSDDDTVQACRQPAGYVEVGGDCHDSDRRINPNAVEVCDGVDNDCDGVIDGEDALGLRTFYRDVDGDGFGDPDDSVVACTTPEGYVDDDRDCDDDDDSINPDAEEVCDGVDNNCSGEIDDAGDQIRSAWYADVDGDTWGDPDDVVFACDPVEGRVERAGDCNDNDPFINPDAVEVCNGVDDNCNDHIDEGVGSTFFRDADRDGYGDITITTIACEAPLGYVDNPDDCDDANPLRFPGNPEVCDNFDNDCNFIVDDGVGTIWYVDGDGDGWGNVAIQACVQPPGTVTRGGDCNDGNPNVNPDALELCSTPYDDNCNDEINEPAAIDARWWFLDGDGDGQGGAAPLRIWPVAIRSCTRPPDFCAPIPIFGCAIERIRYVDNEMDCDDSSARARVGGGPEVCDGYDNDCDGTRDNGFEPRNVYYYDDDGDGWGDSSRRITACTRPIDNPDKWVTQCCDVDDDDRFRW